MMQKQQQNSQQPSSTKSGVPPPSNFSGNAGGSSLPPISSSQLGTTGTNQNKYQDPKSGRALIPSNNSQKRRKKYRINYAQQVSIRFMYFASYCHENISNFHVYLVVLATLCSELRKRITSVWSP